MILKDVEKHSSELTREEELQNQLSQQLNLPGLQETITKPQPPEEKVRLNKNI